MYQSTSLNYKDPKLSALVKKPLFDLLINDEDDEESSPYLDHSALIQSIHSEITKILNTRLPARKEFYANAKDDPFCFGLPSLYGLSDFNSFDAANKSQWAAIQKMCVKVISRFEPRLKDISATVIQYDTQTGKLQMTLSGCLTLFNQAERVHFPVAICCRSGG